MKRTYLVTIDQPDAEPDEQVALSIEDVVNELYDFVTVTPWSKHNVTGSPFPNLFSSDSTAQPPGTNISSH